MNSNLRRRAKLFITPYRALGEGIIDLFQVHGVDERGKSVVRKQLRRSQVIAFFGNLPPCLIGMEACASAHHWDRMLERS